ncbi:MAG: DUF3093 family protein [Micromonosporaceae bacterium]|nr:DUF3093 family protein [Micromonosporaceae bacterium]
MAEPTTIAHQEWLRVPWWWWLPALAVTGLLATPLALGAPGPLRPVGFAAPVLAVAAGLWWLGRIRVAVAVPVTGEGGAELLVDDARLPAQFIAEVVALDPAGRRELLGTAADPLAFVVQRPWVAGAVQVVLDDPADPTPYWLVSTRHPDRLAAALGRRSGPG